MAPAEMVTLLYPEDGMLTSEPVMFISLDTTAAALPLWASLSITFLGAAVAGLLMFLAFRMQTWMSPVCPKECKCKDCYVHIYIYIYIYI